MLLIRRCFPMAKHIAGGHMTDWGNSNLPKINGRPLHDLANPIRWLETQRPPNSRRCRPLIWKWSAAT